MGPKCARFFIRPTENCSCTTCELGSIEVGNHADLVVLDRDYFFVADAEIPKIRSLLTVVGGNVSYDAGVL